MVTFAGVRQREGEARVGERRGPAEGSVAAGCGGLLASALAAPLRD